MSQANEFLRQFGLVKRNEFGGYILISVKSVPETVTLYLEYKYYIELIFKRSEYGTYENLSASIDNTIFQEHTLRNGYNTYQCQIDNPNYGDIIEEEDGTVTVHLIGHSYRM